MSATAIQARGLAKAYGDITALSGLDLDVRQGSIHGLLGLNGAGKSTAIRLLATLVTPSGGSARIAGFDVRRQADEVRGVVALVAEQDGAEACRHWTALEYVTYFARLWGKVDAKGQAGEALRTLGIADEVQRRTMASYSTGMRRRVEIARGLLGSPRVLFLDEPSRGLDLPSKRDLWQLVRRLARQHGVTVLVSSHEVAEIRALCSSLTVLHEGKSTYEGPTTGLGADDATFEANLVRLLKNGPLAQASMARRG